MPKSADNEAARVSVSRWISDGIRSKSTAEPELPEMHREPGERLGE